MGELEQYAEDAVELEDSQKDIEEKIASLKELGSTHGDRTVGYVIQSCFTGKGLDESIKLVEETPREEIERFLALRQTKQAIKHAGVVVGAGIMSVFLAGTLYVYGKKVQETDPQAEYMLIMGIIAGVGVAFKNTFDAVWNLTAAIHNYKNSFAVDQEMEMRDFYDKHRSNQLKDLRDLHRTQREENTF